jgi:hypothetical protein
VGVSQNRTTRLRIAIAALSLGLIGVLDILIGILRPNHVPVLPGLLALALATAVWQGSLLALIIASVLTAVSTIGLTVQAGLSGFLFSVPFLAAVVQAIPVLRSAEKPPRSTDPIL